MTNVRTRPPRAFSLVKVLTAATVLTVLGLPVFVLSVRNVRGVGSDRVRLVADQLARSTVERYGLEREPIEDQLSPSASDAAVLEARDPWERSPAVYGVLACAPLASRGLSLKLELMRELARGTDLLVCEVSRFPEGDRQRPRTRATHLRSVVHAHLHATI